MHSGGETTLSNLGILIPASVSGHLFWKYKDASAMASCNANILGIHSNYQLKIDSSSSLQLNGIDVITMQTYNEGQWYHFGFVYD